MQLVGARRPIVGLPVREALPELAGQGFYELLDRVYGNGERIVGNDVPAKLDRRGDGRPDDAFVSFVYEPIRDLDDKVTGILVVAFDVTVSAETRQSLQRMLAERERLLAVAEAARQQAEVASRAKDDFLATASHELRTPLNAILGWARLLRSGNLEHSNFVRGLETIERNAVAQVQLIEDILDGSRVVTGNLHLEVRPLNMTAVVNAALDAVRPSALAKSIAIAVALDPAAAHIKGDPDRLQQVVWNLVNNAIKFTPKGGRIDVRLDRVGTSIDLSVKDTGQGIDDDFLPHVFDRFRQADESTTRRHGGLGLGLALVRHLVEAHGGTTRAESAGVGKGATFTVTLPVIAVVAEEPRVVRQTPTTAARAAAAARNSLEGVRVLVVDDEPDARDLVATALRTRGADVTAATSAAQAIELIRKRAPMVLVSDIGMPVDDGFALIQRVRALDDTASQLPAIALTAYARDDDRRRALDAGFQAYLSKPVEPDALVRLVSELALRE
jgi:signal transduction histidine kinase/CheY-like chemotaxis protein